MHTTTSQILINAPANKVWEALTNPALVKQWQYGSNVITDWNVGSPIRFRSEWEGTVYEQWGTVLEVTPHKLIKYSLFAPQPDVEDKPENYFTMIYQLEDQDGGTMLSIIQEDPRESTADRSDDDEGGKAVLEALKNLVEAQ
jgi:uncharacterized protein YndB with AHSA1/START domain